MWQGRPGRAAQAARQKRNTVDQQGLALTYALAAKGPDDLFSLVLNAQQGNRNEANRLAEAIDQRPFGYATLMQAIYYCTCGAPFDLAHRISVERLVNIWRNFRARSHGHKPVQTG
jgi:hypothetical protein